MNPVKTLDARNKIGYGIAMEAQLNFIPVPPGDLHQKIQARDKHMCVLCGVSCAGVYRFRGCRNKIGNAVTICPRCRRRHKEYPVNLDPFVHAEWDLAYDKNGRRYWQVRESPPGIVKRRKRIRKDFAAYRSPDTLPSKKVTIADIEGAAAARAAHATLDDEFAAICGSF